ncbi:MAG: heparinase II/III family protein [Armatimonadetes bacterium]|nr:heparinase II/III family protein [Armatimonadota bacterium]
MKPPAATFGIIPVRLLERPYLHIMPLQWEYLRGRQAEQPSPAFQNCEFDLRPGPDRPARTGTAVLEGAAFVAAVTGTTGDLGFLRAHLDTILPSAGMELLSARRGGFLAACSFAYDILAGTLDEATHAALRRTLTDHASRAAAAVERELAGPWAYEDPDIVATLAGLSLAALALLPVEPEAARWLEPADAALETVLEHVATDGWWPSGFEDWNTLLPLLVRVADVWERLADRDRFEHGVFREAAQVALHALAPNGRDVLDLDRVGRPELPRVKAAAESRPYYRWPREPARWALARLAKRFPTAAFRAALSRWEEAELGRGSPFAVLWDEPARRIAPLQSHHVFAAHGLAVWRSGWQAGALQIALAAGPAYGRPELPDGWRPRVAVHPDANHFTVAYAGEPIVFDTGALAEPTTQPHNTVLIDGLGQLPGPALPPGAAELSAAWLSPLGGSLVGLADGSYPPEVGLQTFERQLGFTSGYLLVFDQLAADRPCAFEWLMHTPGQITTGDNPHEAQLLAGTAALRVQVLRPDRVRLETVETCVGEPPVPLSRTLQVACTAEVYRTQFLVLLLPGAPGAAAAATAGLVTGETTVGARLAWENGDREWVLFPTAGRGIALDHLLSDAAYLALRTAPEGPWRQLIARRVTRALVPGGEVLTASQPVDAALSANPLDVSGAVYTRTGATVGIGCPFVPRGVMVDGVSGRAGIDAAARMAVIRLTAGRHEIRITGRRFGTEAQRR